MRTQALMPALVALATLGCAELAAIAPSVTIDVVATQRQASRSTEARGAWSWGVRARLGARLDRAASAPGEGPDGREALPPGELPPGELPSGELPPGPASPCRIAPICAWEARARARAIVRARALSTEEEP